MVGRSKITPMWAGGRRGGDEWMNGFFAFNGSEKILKRKESGDDDDDDDDDGVVSGLCVCVLT
jgi:hypothetical protein